MSQKRDRPQALAQPNVPFSQEAEEAAIGAALVNPEAYLVVCKFLRAEHFFLLRNAYIWQALERLYTKETPIDYLTAVQELKDLGRLDEIGGPAYLTHLVNQTPTSIYAEDYARIVERKAVQRRLLAAADEIKGLALDDELAVETAQVEAYRRMDAVWPADNERHLAGSQSIDAYDAILEEIAGKKKRGEMVGYPLPATWSDLRKRLPTVLPGLVVVSGLPGSGKSAFMETWAEWLAGLGAAVDYIHTEMSTEDLLHRRSARHSGVPYYKLATGEMTEAEYTRVVEGGEEVGKFASSLDLIHMPDVKFDRLAAQMRRDAKLGVKVFFLDHFQDIQVTTSREENVVQAYERACTWLAAFAEFRGVVVIAGSQVNKAGDTKWARKLEEKAVVRITINQKKLKSEYAYWFDGVEHRSFEGEHDPIVEVILKKARFGKVGTTRMLHHGPGFTWMDKSRAGRKPSGKVVSYDNIAPRSDLRDVEG